MFSGAAFANFGTVFCSEFDELAYLMDLWRVNRGASGENHHAL